MATNFRPPPDHGELLSPEDYVGGSALAILMVITSWLSSPGMSLVATFVPGIVFAWFAFTYLYHQKKALPVFHALMPWYLLTLGVQFIHFSEEYIGQFYQRFPVLYGGEPFTPYMFVVGNMIVYFLFLIAPLLVYYVGRRFLFVPILFFIVFGTLGNAIVHTGWTIQAGDYFPGFYTAQLYWVLAPILLMKVFRSKRAVGVFMGCMIVVLAITLTALRS